MNGRTTSHFEYVLVKSVVDMDDEAENHTGT